MPNKQKECPVQIGDIVWAMEGDNQYHWGYISDINKQVSSSIWIYWVQPFNGSIPYYLYSSHYGSDWGLSDAK